ncbi:polar amino acid transport system substrate-binding protein [Oxalobacteraceae bacterium GrIS 1.11]
MRSYRLICMIFCLLPTLAVPAAELVVLVDRASDMPMAAFASGNLVAGIHKDLGETLARKLGRQVRFVILPRKRIARALQLGEADILCGYAPQWLQGDYLWSRTVFSAEEVLVTDTSVAAPHSIEDVRGQAVGTILGYAHPEMEKLLGKDFVRDDAPNMEVNLEKFARGRVHHILIAKGVLEYRQRLRQAPLKLYPPLPVMSFSTRCAVSRKGHVSLSEIDDAIGQAYQDGTIASMLNFAK